MQTRASEGCGLGEWVWPDHSEGQVEKCQGPHLARGHSLLLYVEIISSSRKGEVHRTGVFKLLLFALICMESILAIYALISPLLTSFCVVSILGPLGEG